jgi:hypothetical protein
VVLDWHELVERRFRQPRSGEARYVDAQQLAQQAGGERWLVPYQRDHTLVYQGWHTGNPTPR